MAGQLANLGLSLQGLAVRTNDVAGYREACTPFADAVERGLRVAPGEALRAGLAWQAMALDGLPDGAQAATAGDGVLRARRVLLTGQLLRSAKETWLRTSSDVASVTALAHVKANDPVAAVAALENGRALILSEALPPVEALRTTHPDLARRYTAATSRSPRVSATPTGAAPPRRVGVETGTILLWALTSERGPRVSPLSRMVGCRGPLALIAGSRSEPGRCWTATSTPVTLPCSTPPAASTPRGWPPRPRTRIRASHRSSRHPGPSASREEVSDNRGKLVFDLRPQLVDNLRKP